MREFKVFVGLTTKDGQPVDESAVIVAFSNHFPGFTVRRGTGYWMRASEPSLTFELVDEDSQEATVKAVAAKLAQAFNQTAVLVTNSPVEVEFVAASQVI